MDIMIDLETYSTRPNATIRSIGAVIFKPNTIDNFRLIAEAPFTKFELGVIPDHDKPRHYSHETLQWWGKQGVQAQEHFNRLQNMPLELALLQLSTFIKTHKPVNGWSFGGNFDHVILDDAYTQYGMDYPIPFRNRLCLRTITTIFGNGIPRPYYSDDLKHSALHDSIVQASWYQRIMNQGKIEETNEIAK